MQSQMQKLVMTCMEKILQLLVFKIYTPQTAYHINHFKIYTKLELIQILFLEIELEKRVAELYGKEAALLVSSGTCANLIAGNKSLVGISLSV